MGVFHFLKIVQIVPNGVKRLIYNYEGHVIPCKALSYCFNSGDYQFFSGYC